MKDEPLTYKSAGVDIDAANQLVRRIKHHLARTFTPQVVRHYGGFSGLFRLEIGGARLFGRYRKPLLLAATDGVGTKLKIAFRLGIHNTVGIDLVAMCVNDLLVYGAKPLFFLDYFACGKLELGVADQVVEGIANGCRQAGCALIGGETAELPGFYRKGEYDLAGFAVGVVDERRMITGARVEAGDVVLGLASSGLHSNGYSLVRKVVSRTRMRLAKYYIQLGCTLGEELLRPTRIYVRDVLDFLSRYRRWRPVAAMAHITGGGLVENIPRVLPPNCRAVIKKDSWEVPPIFRLLQERGKIADAEMWRVFNMGVGFVLILKPPHLNPALRFFRRRKIPAFHIGTIDEGPRGVRIV